MPGANLTGVDLSGAVLDGANLRYADLSGTTPTRVFLAHADLSGANLSGADLPHTHMQNAWAHYPGQGRGANRWLDTWAMPTTVMVPSMNIFKEYVWVEEGMTVPRIEAASAIISGLGHNL